MKRTLKTVLSLLMSGALMFGVPAAAPAFGAVKKKTTKKTTKQTRRKATANPRKVTTRSRAAVETPKTKAARRTRRAKARYSPWDTPTFADSTWGDVVAGEDMAVRRAAVQALGPYNGSVVVVDPHSGRILSMVNQKLALTGAYQPCSTIKLVASLAGLSEGVIERETRLRLSRRSSMDLTTALAHSNNLYFANVGEKLGFEKVYYYGRLLGLGEKAGLNIEGESPGIFPEEKPKDVPVGLMTSFGEAISITPMQLAALVSSIANGGTLYFLQYPHSAEEAAAIEPKVKRHLDFTNQLPEIKPGMGGAVDFGTARRAGYDANEPIFGKTGTCTDSRTHLGWFGSYNQVGHNPVVVVVLLTGGKGVNGPVAAGIAGQVYKNLSQDQFFAADRLSPSAGDGSR